MERNGESCFFGAHFDDGECRRRLTIVVCQIWTVEWCCTNDAAARKMESWEMESSTIDISLEAKEKVLLLASERSIIEKRIDVA